MNIILFFKRYTPSSFVSPQFLMGPKRRVNVTIIVFLSILNTFVHFCPNAFLFHFLLFMGDVP